jgi:(2Fe-2S) ferredoxin
VPHFVRHIFVCENERAPDNPRGCCKAKGSPEVRAAFKAEIAQRGLKATVRANMAGCLDQCERGVTVCVYPEQVWYGGVTVDDVREIMEKHIVGGDYVERLLMPNQPHLKGK